MLNKRVQSIGIKTNICEVLYLLYTFCFLENIFLLHTLFFLFFFMNIIFFIKSNYKGGNSIKTLKGESPLKGSSQDCTCVNTDYVTCVNTDYVKYVGKMCLSPSCLTHCRQDSSFRIRLNQHVFVSISVFF